jgi:hypothetical protein
MARIILATHGPKEPGVADPGLTKNGRAMIASLFTQGQRARRVVFGAGKRFRESWEASGLTTKGDFRCREDSHVGVKASGELIGEKIHVRLEDNTLVTIEEYNERHKKFSDEEVINFLASLSDGTVVFTGREVIAMLGVQNASSAAIYQAEVENGQIKKVVLIKKA